MITRLKALIKLLRKKRIVPIPVLKDYNNLLDSKVALIVGGGSGIGFSIADAFVKSGAKVILSGRSKDKLIKACNKLPEGKANYFVWDISEVNSYNGKIEELCNLFPEKRIDILVNSAGIHHLSSFESITEKEFDSIINTNMKGTFFLCRYIGLYMKSNGIKGHILNLSSSSALRPAWGPYQMSKWALNGFTIGLAKKLQPYGIVVNAIAPGQTATPMLNIDQDDLSTEYAVSGRYIVPSEIANLAVIMCSDIGNVVVGDTLYATAGSGLLSLEN